MNQASREFNDVDFRSMSLHLLNILVPMVVVVMLATVICLADDRMGYVWPILILFTTNVIVSTLQKKERYRNLVSLTALRFCLSFPMVCWIAYLTRDTAYAWIFFLPHCFAIPFALFSPNRKPAFLAWNAASYGFLCILYGRFPGAVPIASLALVTVLSWSGALILERNLALIQKLPEEDREQWGRFIGNQALIGFLVLLAGIFLTAALLKNEIRHRRQQALAALTTQVQSGIRGLNLHLSSQRDALEAMSAFFEGSDQVDGREFGIFAGRLLPDHPFIKAFQWVPKVSLEGKAGFESELAAESGREFRIVEPGTGSMVPVQPRGDYFPIRYVFPFEPNAGIWGLDVAFTPARRACVDSALARMAYTLCRPRKLLQDSLKEWTGLAYMPVVKKDMAGIVVALLRLEKLVHEYVIDPIPAGFSVDVDFLSGAEWAPMLASGRPGMTPLLVETSEQVGGLRFRARIGAPPGFPDGPFTKVDAFLMAVGISVSVLLAYFIFHARKSSLPLEIKVLERTRELQRVVIRAEESNQAKSRFLAQMSHEIRTPLNGVLGMSEALLHSGISRESKESVELIKASGLGLLTILNDVLDVSKIESGKMELELKPFRTGALIAEVMGIMKFDAEARGVSLELKPETPVPEWVLGDRLRVRQILLNLLNNALKFTPRGTVTLFPAFTEPDRFLIRIVDSGIGISKANLEKLFQPFEQGDSSTTRKFGGTGLGLVISMQLARMMDGDIRVQSTEGVGSEFSLSLSLPVSQPAPASGKETLEPLRKGRRLLLAEDNAVNVRVAKALLEDYFESIDVAGTGKEALDMLADRDYELVLMDLQMPVMDGLQAAREIRKNPRWAGLPIVALSANAFASDRKSCLGAGMQDFLEKPITKVALHRVLAQYLGVAAA
ncbi:MAG: multi-sensor hybrid histidine kinase [Fibrobacteres bacterium]|nr:multi-sensor hybrid histidine kinase [Fibrobacterota bacterium]